MRLTSCSGGAQAATLIKMHEPDNEDGPETLAAEQYLDGSPADLQSLCRFFRAFCGIGRVNLFLTVLKRITHARH